MHTELTQDAKEVMNQYLSLRIGETSVRTPYFNNARGGVRMALRALVGKGSPEEIMSEATLYALREHINIHNFSSELLTKFLVDHRLGIDCSGLSYYILDAESRARGYGSLRKHMHFPFVTNIFKKIFNVIRNGAVENADVRTFAHPSNSHEVAIRDAQAGDFFVNFRHRDYERNHMWVVTKVDDGNIHLVHSIALPNEGKYGHGVREESISNTALEVELPGSLHRLNWFTSS